MERIEIGDVIRDNHGRDGIVVALIERPDPQWLAAQLDSRMREVPIDERWFRIYPFCGGAVDCSESLMTRLRTMTPEDFQKAYRRANGFAQDKLDELFPELRRVH